MKSLPSGNSAQRKFRNAAPLKQWYLVMGKYDAVVISEFPNDEAARRADLMTAMLGSIRSEGFRAFTEEEYKKLIASLP